MKTASEAPIIGGMCDSSSASASQPFSILIGLSLACSSSTPAQPSADDARAFLKEANDTLLRLGNEASQAGWVQNTFITVDTEAINARASEAFMTAVTDFAKRATAVRRRRAGTPTSGAS